MNDPKNLQFTDLSTFDIELIKSRAKDEYVKTANLDVSTALMQVMFEMISAKGYAIVRDETKEATWSKPKDSWYDTRLRYKKPWMF